MRRPGALLPLFGLLLLGGALSAGAVALLGQALVAESPPSVEATSYVVTSVCEPICSEVKRPLPPGAPAVRSASAQTVTLVCVELRARPDAREVRWSWDGDATETAVAGRQGRACTDRHGTRELRYRAVDLRGRPTALQRLRVQIVDEAEIEDGPISRPGPTGSG